ncbi:hypothetical protein BpHYR1_027006 [Brachionus plicatilis]|uniref:Uncharacterized protein n=1 Tax=Brachionus plicatilis TaxID=10195 RepID=A0A3M7SPP6_BRAPC|nr:hypothetical protein BpHYR1_027006 [Brachionus plicatilis]
MCWKILKFQRGNYKEFDQKSTSLCKQLNNVEKKTHIDVTDYSSKASINGYKSWLVDSIEFIVSRIKYYSAHGALNLD